MKQGASHPIHQQVYLERQAYLQEELAIKDEKIQQLSQKIN